MATINAIVTRCDRCPCYGEYGCNLDCEQLSDADDYPGVPSTWNDFSFCCTLKHIEYLNGMSFIPERKRIVYE
jgi:hypothetical protein